MDAMEARQALALANAQSPAHLRQLQAVFKQDRTQQRRRQLRRRREDVPPTAGEQAQQEAMQKRHRQARELRAHWDPARLEHLELVHQQEILRLRHQIIQRAHGQPQPVPPRAAVAAEPPTRQEPLRTEYEQHQAAMRQRQLRQLEDMQERHHESQKHRAHLDPARPKPMEFVHEQELSRLRQQVTQGNVQAVPPPAAVAAEPPSWNPQHQHELEMLKAREDSERARGGTPEYLKRRAFHFRGEREELRKGHVHRSQFRPPTAGEQAQFDAMNEQHREEWKRQSHRDLARLRDIELKHGSDRTNLFLELYESSEDEDDDDEDEPQPAQAKAEGGPAPPRPAREPPAVPRDDTPKPWATEFERKKHLMKSVNYQELLDLLQVRLGTPRPGSRETVPSKRVADQKVRMAQTFQRQQKQLRGGGIPHPRHFDYEDAAMEAKCTSLATFLEQHWDEDDAQFVESYRLWRPQQVAATRRRSQDYGKGSNLRRPVLPPGSEVPADRQAAWDPVFELEVDRVNTIYDEELRRCMVKLEHPRFDEDVTPENMLRRHRHRLETIDEDEKRPSKLRPASKEIQQMFTDEKVAKRKALDAFLEKAAAEPEEQFGRARTEYERGERERHKRTQRIAREFFFPRQFPAEAGGGAGGGPAAPPEPVAAPPPARQRVAPANGYRLVNGQTPLAYFTEFERRLVMSPRQLSAVLERMSRDLGQHAEAHGIPYGYAQQAVASRALFDVWLAHNPE